LYDNEEIEVEAVIKWDSQHRRWMAAPLWDKEHSPASATGTGWERTPLARD
jgi:hypothetical protein